jgi:hypothetical protein
MYSRPVNGKVVPEATMGSGTVLRLVVSGIGKALSVSLSPAIGLAYMILDMNFGIVSKATTIDTKKNFK